MFMRRIFETALERLGRIIAGQYGLTVVFQGSGASTDGKTIYLPSTNDLTDELMADMNGFLDHEVAHCRFTDFGQLKKLMEGRGKRFQKELLNGIEDVRIEREQVKDFPGCRLNLEPLHTKLRIRLEEQRAKGELPWPFRLIVTAMDAMDNVTPLVVDEDTAPVWELIKDLIPAFNAATSTSDVREAAETATKRILDYLDEQAEKEGDEGEESKDKSGKGKGKGKGEGKGEKSDAPAGGGTGDEMMDEEGEETGEGETSGWDDADTCVDDMVNRELADHFSEDFKSKSVEERKDADTLTTDKPGEGAKRRDDHDRLGPTKGPGSGIETTDKSMRFDRIHIPFSTRFDEVRDHTGKGHAGRYNEIRRKVQPLIAPIERALERHLKVKEQVKWRGDRERGMIDVRGLPRMLTDPNFRRPFKEQTKVETNNVAVEILIDLSGSMAGPKTVLTKQAAVAMAEALQKLGIPFEITGFHSEYCPPLHREAEAAGVTKGATRFNRFAEKLVCQVFKSFDSHDLSGIEKLDNGHNNPDGEAVKWAADRLAMQKQKRKILIVMSDGSPSTGDSDRQALNADLKTTVAKIIKSGVEVVAFGITTDSPRHFYPDFVLINRVEELPAVTMGKLARMLGY